MRLILRWSCQSLVQLLLRDCMQISTLYYIQSVTVLDVVALENTGSLSINMVIMCASIVHDVVFSCASFTSSFKICKELFIMNFPSLQGFSKLLSNNFTVKYPYSTVQINVCACVTLDISLPCNMLCTVSSAYINSNNACTPDPCIIYSIESIKLIICWKPPTLSTMFLRALDSSCCLMMEIDFQ